MSRQDANAAFALSSFLQGANATYIDELYARYEKDPSSVDAEWQEFFKSLKDSPADVQKNAEGPSWERSNWPLTPKDDLTSAMDGNWAQVEKVMGAKLAAKAGLSGVQLYLREEQTAPLLEKLGAGQLDLVLVALPYDTSDFETLELGEDRILVVLPRDHALARLPRIDRDALAKENLLLMEDGHCLRNHALEACRLAGPNRNEVFQGTSLRTVIQMAAGGLGVSLIPQMAVAAELPADGNLVARPLGADAPPRRIALAWRRSAARKADLRRFGAYVKAVLATLQGGKKTERSRPTT